MTPERFGALADAYGGDLDCWPSSERDDARALLVQQPHMRAVLSNAAALDAVLAAWTVPGPGAALAAGIAMIAMRRHAQARRLRLWLSGLGAATALAGGMAAGGIVVMLSAPTTDQVTAPLYQLSVLGAPLDVEAAPATGGGL